MEDGRTRHAKLGSDGKTPLTLAAPSMPAVERAPEEGRDARGPARRSRQRANARDEIGGECREGDGDMDVVCCSVA